MQGEREPRFGGQPEDKPEQSNIPNPLPYEVDLSYPPVVQLLNQAKQLGPEGMEPGLEPAVVGALIEIGIEQRVSPSRRELPNEIKPQLDKEPSRREMKRRQKESRIRTKAKFHLSSWLSHQHPNWDMGNVFDEQEIILSPDEITTGDYIVRLLVRLDEADEEIRKTNPEWKNWHERD